MVWVAIQTSSSQAHTVTLTVFTSHMFVMPVFVELPNLSATKLFIQVHHYWMESSGCCLQGQGHSVQTDTSHPHPCTKKQQHRTLFYCVFLELIRCGQSVSFSQAYKFIMLEVFQK